MPLPGPLDRSDHLTLCEQNSRLALVMKSGKVNLGYKASPIGSLLHTQETVSNATQSTLKNLRSGKAKLVLIAANTRKHLEQTIVFEARVLTTDSRASKERD
jgi:ribosomal protein L30E